MILNAESKEDEMANESHMNLDRLESWRGLVESTIQNFISNLPSQLSDTLNYSVSSLDELEAWMLDTYSSSIPDESKAMIDNGLMYYIGETFRKCLGGYWNVHFAKVEPDYRYGEDPVIEGFFRDMAISPWVLIGITLEQRSGNYLRSSLETLLKFYKKQ